MDIMYCSEAMKCHDFHIASNVVALRCEMEGIVTVPDMYSEIHWQESVERIREQVTGSAPRPAGRPSSSATTMDEDPPQRKRSNSAGRKGDQKRRKAGGDPDDDGGLRDALALPAQRLRHALPLARSAAPVLAAAQGLGIEVRGVGPSPQIRGTHAGP